MRTFIISLSMIVIGLAFGVTLTEVSLRVFMPQLAEKPAAVDTGYITNITAKSDAELNDKGFRETDELSDLDENSWYALGGSTAFGIGVEEGKRFSEEIESMTGLKVYNAAQVGRGGDMAYEFAGLKRLKSAAKKVVYVVDMGLPPHVLLGVEPKDEVKQRQSVLDNLVLMRVLKGAPAQATPKIAAWTQTDAQKYARNLASVAAKYRNMNEHFIVLMLPAKGHTYKNSFGTVHRNNQELMGQALRQHQGVYAVDLSYLIKLEYFKPLELYNDQNRLNSKGHRMLANGFLKQFEAFSSWRSFDELSPEEQAQVLEDMKRTKEEEARKRGENPF